jgi:hypothetical protein
VLAECPLADVLRTFGFAQYSYGARSGQDHVAHEWGSASDLGRHPERLPGIIDSGGRRR